LVGLLSRSSASHLRDVFDATYWARNWPNALSQFSTFCRMLGNQKKELVRTCVENSRIRRISACVF